MSLYGNNIKKNNSNFDLAIKLEKTTGLNIADFMHGINPREPFRNMSDCLINIFAKERVTKKKIENIFNIYGDRIILEYLEDTSLKNKSILTRSSYGIIEDHVNVYGVEDIKEIIKKYFKEEDMTEKEKYILMGLLQKIAELVETYKMKNIGLYHKSIKAEMDIGIFNNIVVYNKKYSNKKRRDLIKLANYWNKETFKKYDNLDLLELRLQNIPNTLNLQNKINKYLQMDIDSIIMLSGRVKDGIEEIYLEYEGLNRRNIIDKVYMPEKFKKNIVIDSPSQMSNTSILHFFGIYNKVFTLENYILKLEKEFGRKLTMEEIASARKAYEIKTNNFIPNKSINMKAIGQSTSGELYNVNTSNQLSCMFIKFEDILKMKGIKGNLALGFAKDNLQEELIATISNKNIHSNKNIENIEVNDDFKEFSCSFDELLNMPKEENNTELVMFRNTDLATLKPSYVLYISYRYIYSEEERKNIKFYKERMKEAGLDVPFIVFDTFTIKQKIKQNKEEQER